MVNKMKREENAVHYTLPSKTILNENANKRYYGSHFRYRARHQRANILMTPCLNTDQHKFISI